jgi:hypothetical protein
LWAANADAQTTINPDISAIGDIRMFMHSDSLRPTESNEFNLQTPNLELMVSGYLNPYSRADAVLAWEGDENASIEELYATVMRGLPLDMNLRAGKYRLEFGRLNTVHPHAYSFVNVPLPHEQFFGEEGLNDMALRASFALPTGKMYTELMGAVLKGDILQGEEEAKSELPEDTIETHIKPGFFGRLTTSTSVSENAELALGLSTVTAEHDRDEHLRTWISGLDFKYKWRPNRYTSLTVEGELLRNSREQTEPDKLVSWGGYAYVDYRFHQEYNAGSIYEYTEAKDNNEVKQTRYGLFVGFAPIEETSLVRLVGNWTDLDEQDSFWTMTLQFVFSLGPHQPHNF